MEFPSETTLNFPKSICCIWLQVNGTGDFTWKDDIPLSFQRWHILHSPHVRLFSARFKTWYEQAEEFQLLPDTVVTVLQPSVKEEANCVAVVFHSTLQLEWATIPCQQTFNRTLIICQLNLNKTYLKPGANATVLSPSYKECSHGWTKIGRRCHLIFNIAQHDKTQCSEVMGICEGQLVQFNLLDSSLELFQLQYYHKWLEGHQPKLIYGAYGMQNSTVVCSLVQLIERLRLHAIHIASLSETPSSVACEREMSLSNHDCLENHHRCEDSTCILGHYKCDGVWDCPDGSDEDDCTTVCQFWEGGMTDMPLRLCYDSCFPENCTCHALYYQCELSGGCIPASRVCDGTDDCKEREDELACINHEMKTPVLRTELGLVCINGTHIPIGRVNDLIPDCPGSLAEDEMALQLYYKGDEIGNSANNEIYARNCSVTSAQCIKGFPYACYPRDKICVYEVNPFTKVLMHCRNGAHLSDCAQHECPSRFKCTKSYCIPFHYVCNGRLDCPGGEDEDNCAVLKCQGLLRCRHDNVCVHPNQVGDNVTDCQSKADDELVFDDAICPRQCQCLGHAIVCVGADAGVLKQTSRFMKKIVFIQRTGSANIDLHFPKLLFLDISNNSLKSESFPKMHSLTQLQSLILKNNGIKYISKNFLEGPVLHSVEFQMNPLHTIAPASFSRLPNLKSLNLSHCSISSVHKGTFDGLVELNTLDLSYNPLDDWRPGALSTVKATLCNLKLQGQMGIEWLLQSANALPNLCSINVETSRICHYLPKSVRCHSRYSPKGKCCKLIESVVTEIFTCLIFTLLLGFHVVALLYWCRCKAKRAWKILMIVSNACGLFWSLYLSFVIFLQYHYGKFFFAYEDFVVRSLYCKFVGMLFLKNYLLGLLTQLTVSYHHHLVIAKPFEDPSSVLVCYTTVCIMVVALTVVLFLYNVFGEHIFLTNPACHIYPITSNSVSYWYVYVVVLTLTDVIFRSSTAVYYLAASHALKYSGNTARSSGGTGKKKAATFKLKCLFVLEMAFLLISCAVQLLVSLLELNNDYVLACTLMLMVKDILNPVFHTFMVSNFRNILFKPSSLRVV